MSDQRLAPLMAVMERSGLDAIAVVPGSNFLRLFGKDFHQMERPLVVIVPRTGTPAAIVPHLEMGSFRPLGFEGTVFPWRDEEGYAGAFAAAGRHFGGSLDGRRLGVEGQRMRVFDFLALREALPRTEFRDAHREISTIRLHKTADEIAALTAAIRLSEAALEATLAEVKIGMTETEIESILLRQLFAHGADGLSFDPIVAAGDNSARPHAKARGSYRIKAGDALLFDFGGRHRGFSADITRTFFVGHVSDHDRAFYDTVLAANARGRELSRPGLTASDLDDAVLTVLERSQFRHFTRHKTGHGLGLDVHEAPQIMRGNPQMLEPGMVFTIEPGLYREDEAGVRIEDNVVITEDGAVCLTTFPRELRIIAAD
jgi:Xaa-Pro dipeptidase